MSIFSPRSSRMIDCTRVPFMPTQAPTGSTSRSREYDRDLGAIARLADGAADHHGAVVDLRHFLLEQLDEQRRIGAREDDLRTLRAAVDALDHGADAVPRRVAFRARLLLARQHRLDAADLDDDVAVLEALDGAVDDLADALVVLGEDVLALGLAHLLEDHLLGGLRGDAAEHFGRLRKLHLVAELDAVGNVVAVERRYISRASSSAISVAGVRHLLDDCLQREQIDLAGLGVEPRLQVLAGLVVLARRGGDRFLDRADHDVRLDAFFLRERFDRLLQRIRHSHFQVSAVGFQLRGFQLSVQLELHFQTCPRDRRERHAVRLPIVGLDQHVGAVDAGEPAPKSLWPSTFSRTTIFASRPANRR